MATHGNPTHLRSDNGPEFMAHQLQDWLKAKQVKALYITPGSPWEQAWIESFGMNCSTVNGSQASSRRSGF